ncbi:hypothetical protein LUW75_22425 [Streptomyces sp. MRC013]|uniref:hypothetical protein n=1 Tax=Streptomyces sp. MRC013 TaxID=2898276 RepID=UPI002026270A|nr:hypothetical protein [Streptomyces sp. MRC013]URM92253.1 hypothetical protein LUW75_22425 [Streptomyces sp. MRC013]
MSDWTREYEPDAVNVVGGLDMAQRREVEAIAQRIADAVGVRRIGEPFDITESASGVRTFAEGAVTGLVPGGLPRRRRHRSPRTALRSEAP